MNSRVVRFGMVGLVNTAIGLAVLYAALFAGFGDFLSNALGYGSGLIVSFFLHRGWTFAGKTNSLPRDAGGFVVAWIIAYLANLAAITFGRSVGFIDNPLVQLAGVGAFTVTFYVLTTWMVFTGKPSPDIAATPVSDNSDRLQDGSSVATCSDTTSG
jgi:putative flippase GtrA